MIESNSMGPNNSDLLNFKQKLLASLRKTPSVNSLSFDRDSDDWPMDGPMHTCPQVLGPTKKSIV